jgi:hypothetical protein
MTNQSQSRDPRLVGALLALALDAALLAFAALLVVASVSAATGIVLTGTAGLVVAPLLGWRYGRRAVSRTGDDWSGDALRTVLLIGAGFVAGFVALQTLAVPVQGGIGDRMVYVVYSALMGTVVVVVLTLVVAVPVGLVWKRLMHRAARRRSYP